MLGLMAHGRSCFFNLLVLLFMLLYLLLENSKLKRLHRGPVLFKLQYNTGMSNTTTARPIQFHLLSPVKLSFCVSVTKFNHTFKTWDVLVKEQEVQNFKTTAKKKSCQKGSGSLSPVWRLSGPRALCLRLRVLFSRTSGLLSLSDTPCTHRQDLFWSCGAVSQPSNQRREGSRACHVTPPSPPCTPLRDAARASLSAIHSLRADGRL